MSLVLIGCSSSRDKLGQPIGMLLFGHVTSAHACLASLIDEFVEQKLELSYNFRCDHINLNMN